MKLTDLTADDRLDALYHNVIKPSFPDDELESFPSLEARVRDGTTRACAMIDASGSIVAGATAEWSASSRVMLLSYMAVNASERGSGFGGRLLSYLLSRWTAEHRPCLLVGEVEHPDRHHGNSAHGDPVRRLRFYGNHGARVLRLPYFQPALRSDLGRVYGMLLLALHADRELSGAEPASIDGKPLMKWFTDYLMDTEGEVGEDPATSALMSEFIQSRGVPLISVDNYQEVPIADPIR